MDNAYQTRLATQPEPHYAATLQEYCTRVQEEGQSTVVIRLRNWNGQANDPVVTVDISSSVFGAPGTSTTPPAVNVNDGTLVGSGDPARPAWNGNDWFWVRDDMFVAGDVNTPRILDDTAYVRNRVLVMRRPDRALLTVVGPTLGLRVQLTGGFAMGEISEDLLTLENVVFGGRWSKTDLLDTARSVEVCPGSDLYGIVSDAIDKIADVRSNPTEDGTGVPCNAVSFGVRFDGYRAHFAGLAPSPPLPDPCANP